MIAIPRVDVPAVTLVDKEVDVQPPKTPARYVRATSLAQLPLLTNPRPFQQPEEAAGKAPFLSVLFLHRQNEVTFETPRDRCS